MKRLIQTHNMIKLKERKRECCFFDWLYIKLNYKELINFFTKRERVRKNGFFI